MTSHVHWLRGVVFYFFASLALQGCVQAEQSALEDVTSTLCDQTVVLLGEGPSHGEGSTTRFKAELTQNLVERCGFDAIIFESSAYEFADIRTSHRAGEVISETRLAAAVGGLWSDDREFQPLIAFLTRKLNAKRITVAGMDDRLSGRGQDYANDEMTVELTEFLDPTLRDTCRTRFNQKIYSEFSTLEPYSEAFRFELKSCLAAIAAASHVRPGFPVSDSVAALDRWLSRDFLPRKRLIQLRDASMYESYAAFQASPERGNKTIVWGATVHLATSARTLPVFEGEPNFGELVSRNSDPALMAIGFSAGSGSIRLMSGKNRDLEKAELNTLESQVLAQSDRDIVFVDPESLSSFGEIKASALGNKFEVRDWSEMLDGIVVFREQQPTVHITR